MKRMRIAHVIWSLGTGGIETMLVDIVNEQVKLADVCICIINSMYDKTVLASIDKRVIITFCGRKPKSHSILPIIILNYALWRHKPDVVHCHSDKTASLIFYPATKVRTIHNVHSNPKDFKQFSKLFCISKAVKSHIAEQGFPNGILIYNGIHVQSICHTPNSKDAKLKQLKFVCVGRLHPDKGQMLLVEALNNLVNIRGLRGFSIDLIGDGPSRGEIESKVREYHLGDFIHLLGNKSRSYIYSRLCEYDLFILPSTSEGFGLTLSEACAAGVPIITSNLEGPLEIIDGGRLGRVFASGDKEDLTKQIEDFLSKGRDDIQVDAAREFVAAHFDVARTAQQYLENYIV